MSVWFDLRRPTAWLAVLGMAATAVAAAPTEVADGVYAEGQAARGAPLYGRHCAGCHGKELEGSAAPPLTGPFWSSWNDRTLGELFQLVQGSMPADAPSSLADEDYAAILAYLLKAGGHPAGDRALPASAEALAPIRIGPAK